ncbi:MAG: DHH family phosphoesterase [Patescibacteria group bacterium]
MYPANQNTQNSLSKIPEALSKGSSGVIILPQNPTQDAIASACSLYLGLTKIGKNVTIACSSPVQADFVAADKIQTNISTGGDNLVISFPFKEEALDKVDYGFQGDFFNVIVTPRPGQSRLEPNKVKFSYTGGTLDFIITVDAPNLNSLGAIYAENQNEFAGKMIINIDRHLVNDQFGAVNFVMKTASSTSELVYKVLVSLQVEFDREIATNLYSGITVATNNFTSYSVNADTFEAASTLLKAGAMKKAPIRQPGAQIPGMPMQGMAPRQGMPMPPMRPMPMPMGMDLDDDEEDDEFDEMPMPMPRAPMPMRQPMPMPQQQQQSTFSFPQQQRHPQPRTQQAPPPPQLNENMKAVEDVEQEGGTPEAPAAPQDWLKPKIFKGGGGLV